MMHYRISKEFTFDMAHALSTYDGKCRNVHGHTYRLVVTVAGTPVGQSGDAQCGMVMDFHRLKELVQREILDAFDHALVLSEGNPIVVEGTAKIMRFPFEPTTENLLSHFASILSPALPQGVVLSSLRLHETPTSWVELCFD